MQLKKYAVTLAVPVQVLVDAKDHHEACNRAAAMITQKGTIDLKPLKGYSIYFLESSVAKIEGDTRGDEPMIA